MLCEKCENKIPHSRQQLRYWHVAKKVLSEQTGYTPEQMGILIKEQIHRYEDFANRKTGEVLRIYESAGNWKVEEFQEVIEHLLQLAAEWGLQLMTPDEWREAEQIKKTQNKLK